ncbi:MAG: hypothetical protein M0D53_06765 [Flavobacterium sp. JAD_PAG50586_2]|nr:MAG: hypothetical protein M0D53_06765 [Flavobacterium sp. JAD_PAG50586_2]
MSERKNIDRLFQEKFKDFEVNPPEGTWANIEAKLDEKKKRRVIPFWWKLSGVAAVFLVGFLISKSIYQIEITPENPIVNETNSNTTKEVERGNINKDATNEKIIKATNPIVKDNKPNQIKGKSSEGINKKRLENGTYKKSSEAVATTFNEANDNTNSERGNKLKKTASSAKSMVAEGKIRIVVPQKTKQI